VPKCAPHRALQSISRCKSTFDERVALHRADTVIRHRNVKRFRRGLVFKAHRWLHHSTLGSRVIKKKKRVIRQGKELLFFSH